MKIVVGKTPKNNKTRWTRHFFWFPVKIDDAIIWLEWGWKFQRWNETLGWITIKYGFEEHRS